MPHAPRDLKTRVVLREIDADVRILFVVAQENVVARTELLDKIAFQNQRFQLGIGHDRLEIRNVGHHRADFRLVIFVGAEILPNAALQTDRLADVDHLARVVFHDVNAAVVRKRL